MRIVVGHPRLRHPVHSDAQVEDSVSAVRRAAALAEKLGLVLAVENHADLTAVQLERLIRMVGSNRIRVCFDTANAVRVGDEVLEAAQRLSSLVVMAHIKDVTGDPWHPLSGPITAPLGSGVLPLHEVVALLADGHVELPLLVELGHLGPGLVDERHLVGQGIRWLRGNVP
jgi:sugar phosphate isomerase/epimerase